MVPSPPPAWKLSIRSSAFTALICSSVWMGGCSSNSGSGSGGHSGGPDVYLSPAYHAGGGIAAIAANKLPVAVSVIDARTTKNETRPDGREIVAQGDKGKIFLPKPAPKVIEEAMVSALQAAGFTVADKAPVVVEVSLVDLPVQAYQFTHWTLPSERASTLDAFGALFPGPVRDTKAKVALNVVVRKNDARLGFSHVVGADANNKSDDRAVVEKTVDDVINRAVDDAVIKSAPDIEIVTRTPVTAREIGGREDEILKQQQQMKELSELLTAREATVAEDRKALEEMRLRLKEDQQVAQQGLAGDRKALADQKTALAKEREAVEAKLVELKKKPAEDPAAKAAALAIAKEKEAIDAKAKALDDAGTQLEGRRAAIEEREKNVASYTTKLDQQAAGNKALASELTLRQKELEDREKALLTWKADVENRVAQRPPPVIYEKRRPLILITEPAASRTETTLPMVNVTGVAIDDRKVTGLSATINGQPVSNLAAAIDSGGSGIGLKAVQTVSDTTGGPSLASRPFNFAAALKEGSNDIVIDAVDDDNLHTTQKLTVSYDRGSGRIYVIAIGINDYQNRESVPPLRFAVSDAKEIAGTFQKLLGSADSQVRQMLDSQATRANVVRQLFEQLPTEVRPQDTVVIFFSGHGAPDASTDAQGNVETFLLPIDADPARLFSTAIRMHDVATILRRLRSERIVFLADTCYSGAAGAGISGARTVPMPGLAMKGGVGIKAIPDRPRGKGCAVITASSGIQVAQEKTDVQHGVFTHYLLLGLAGAADENHDGHVTVDELFAYVRTQVTKDTAGKQTPQISRDATAGEIILSNVAK